MICKRCGWKEGDDENVDENVVEPVIDKAYIESLRTANGGWTREALASIGVPWPPPKGWKKELEIKAEATRLFARQAYKDAQVQKIYGDGPRPRRR
jgi:hypothetical protein